MPRTLAERSRCLSWVTAASTASCLRPLITTSAPDSARPLAMAKPMPWVEPVMRAVLPDRSMFMERLALEWGDKRDDCVGGRLVQEITIFLAAHNPCGS